MRIAIKKVSLAWLDSLSRLNLNQFSRAARIIEIVSSCRSVSKARIPLMLLLNFYAAFVGVSKNDVNDARCVVVGVGELL